MVPINSDPIDITSISVIKNSLEMWHVVDDIPAHPNGKFSHYI